MKSYLNRFVALLMTIMLLSTCGLPEVIALADGVTIEGTGGAINPAPGETEEEPPAPTEPETVTVTFLDWDDSPVASIAVTKGESLPAEQWPNVPAAREGYSSDGWDRLPTDEVFTAMTESVTVRALYTPLEQYVILVNYIFTKTQEEAAPAYTESVYRGMPYASGSIALPSVPGFHVDTNATSLDASATLSNDALSIAISGESMMRDYQYNIYFAADRNNGYKVEHYLQELDGVNYKLKDTVDGSGETGAYTDAKAKSYPGFTCITPISTANTKISADGSTVIVLKYDRNDSFVLFDSDGGSLVEPIIGLYDEDISAQTQVIWSKNPTKPGYTFDGWYDAAGNEYTKQNRPTKLLESPLSLKAKWKASKAQYTVQYWLQNADDDGYSYFQPSGEKADQVRTATTGTNPASASGWQVFPNKVLTQSEQKEMKYFTYEQAVIEGDDGKGGIRGDGTSVLKVYFTRNSYTIKLRLSGSWTMTFNGTTYNKDNAYSFTARYQQKIASIWPYYGNADFNFNFARWGGTFVSQRMTLSSDVIGSTVNGGTKTYDAYGGSQHRLEVYYMIQPYEGNVGSNDWSKFVEETSFHQSLLSDTTTLDPKKIDGYTDTPHKEKYETDENGKTIYHIKLYYTRNQYTLSFSDQTQVKKSYSVYFGKPITQAEHASFTLEPPAAYKGCTPGGWYTTKDCVAGTEFQWGTTMPCTDLILYMKWVPKTFVVSYDTKLDDLSFAPETVPYGQKLTDPHDSVEEPGYFFLGWYYFDENGVERRFNSSMQITRTYELHAKWRAKVDIGYTVYYKYDGTDTDIAAPASFVGTMGETYTIEALQITLDDGTLYFPDSVSKSITLKAKDNVVTFYYTTATEVWYRVEFWDATNDPLNPVPFATPAAYVKSTTNNGLTVNYTPIPGYKPELYQIYRKLANEDEAHIAGNVFQFRYTRNAGATYQVITHLQKLEGGYTTEEPVLLNGSVGQKAFAAGTPIAGYTFNAKLSIQTAYVRSDNKTELHLYYDRAIYNYTVRYLLIGAAADTEDPDQIVEPDTNGSGRFGSSVQLVAIGNPNYVLFEPTSSPYTLMLNENNSRVVFFYDRLDFGVTVRFVYEDADGLHDLQNPVTIKKKNDKALKVGDVIGYDQVPAGIEQNGQPYLLDAASTPATQTITVSADNSKNELIFKYRPKSYAVTYDANGATAGAAPTDSATYRVGEKFTVLDNTGAMTYGENDFCGWSLTQQPVITDQATLDGLTKYNAGSKLPMEKDGVKLYAVWSHITYTLHYDLNTTDATTGTAPADVTEKSGTFVDVNNGAGFGRVGYTFAGWRMHDANGNPVGETYGVGTGMTHSLTLSENVTLYASWTLNSHAVTYRYVNAPSGAAAVPAAANYNYGAEVDVAAAPAAVVGYTFGGWTTTDATISNGKFVMPDQPVELVGTWTLNKHNVTYGYTGTVPANAPAAPAGATDVMFGTTMGVATTPTMVGYTFSGWTTDNQAVTTNPFNMPDSDVAFTGSWTINQYAVTYQADPDSAAHVGLPTPASADYNYQAEVTVVAPATVPEGYTFAGWLGSDGKLYQPTAKFSMPASDMTLTEQLTINSYEVTYAYTWVPTIAGVTLTAPTDAAQHEYNSTVDAMFPAAVEGYTFQGWTAKAGNATIDPTTHQFTMPAAKVEFEGTWLVNPHTVTVVFEGDVPTGVNPQTPTATYNYGVSVTLPMPASVSGFKFTGYTQSGSTTDLGTSYTFNMPDNDMAFVGHWERRSYNVSYQYEGAVPTGAPALNQTVSVPYQQEISMAAKPSMAGFVFNGWYRKYNNGNVPYTGTTYTVGVGDTVFYGSWTPDTASLSVAGVNEKYSGNAFGVTVNGLIAGDVVEYRVGTGAWSVTPVTRTDVSTTTVEVRVKRADLVIWGKDDSGNGTARTATISITPRIITITAPTKNDYVYDGSTHELPLSGATVSGDGLVSGESLSPVALKDATTGLPSNLRKTVGFNPVVLDQAQSLIKKGSGDDSTKNYTITWNPGKITVGKGVATSGQPTSVTRVYDAKKHSPTENADGTPLNPVFTAQVVDATGAPQTITLVPTGYEYATDPTNGSWSPTVPTYTNAGTYEIYTRMIHDNYTADPVKQTLIISQRHVTVTATMGQSAVYNTQEQYATDYTVEAQDDTKDRGLLTGHTLAPAFLNNALTDVTATPITVSIDKDKTTIIDADGSVKANYIIDAVNGSFIITAATGARVSMDGYTGTYDAEAHPLGALVLLDANSQPIPASEVTSTLYTWTDADGDHSRNVAPKFTDATDATGIKVTVKVSTKNYGMLTNEDNPAIVKIAQRPLKVTLTNYSGVYDGQEHPIKVDTIVGLVTGHTLQGNVEANHPIDVGTYPVTYKNLKVVYGGDHDVTANYTPQIVDGQAAITARTVRFDIEKKSFVFDGLAHSVQATLGTQGTDEGFVTRTGYTEPESFLPDLDAAATQTYVIGATAVNASGTYRNMANGALAANYKPVVTEGSIEITRRPVTITAPSDTTSFTYDGTEHVLQFNQARDVQAFNAADNSGIVDDFTVDIGFLNRSNVRKPDGDQDVVLDPSTLTVTATGLPQNVSAEGQFTFSYLPGKLAVAQAKIPLTLRVAGVRRMYDGADYTIPNNAYSIASGTLVGDQPTLTASVSQQVAPIVNKGTTSTDIDNIKIMDGSDDVTANYDISKDCGEVEVTARPILFTIMPASYMYDTGIKYLSATTGAVNGEGGLLPGTRLSATLIGDGQANPGDYPVTFDLARTFLVDATGAPVDMNNYQVTWREATLSIRRASVRFIVNYYYNGVLDDGETLVLTGLDTATITGVPSKIRAGMRLDRVANVPLTLTYGNDDQVIRVYYVDREPLELIVDVETPLAGSMLGVNVGDCLD